MKEDENLAYHEAKGRRRRKGKWLALPPPSFLVWVGSVFAILPGTVPPSPTGALGMECCFSRLEAPGLTPAQLWCDPELAAGCLWAWVSHLASLLEASVLSFRWCLLGSSERSDQVIKSLLVILKIAFRA